MAFEWTCLHSGKTMVAWEYAGPARVKTESAMAVWSLDERSLKRDSQDVSVADAFLGPLVSSSYVQRASKRKAEVAYEGVPWVPVSWTMKAGHLPWPCKLVYEME